MSNKKFGLVFRMESEGNGAVEGEMTAENTLAVESDAAEATAEVESATGDVTEVVTGIENASEASEELSSIEGSLEEAVESGEGVSPREAEHIQARLERVATLLGTTTADMGLTFRRESFGGSNSRLAATKMRLEFIKGWGTKIWELIKKAWEWLQNTVKNLIGSITSNAETLVTRLQSIEKQVEEKAKKGGTLNTENIKARAKDISISGAAGADTLQRLLNNVKEYAAILDKTSDLVLPANTDKIGTTAEALKSHADQVVKLFIVGEKASAVPKGSPEGSKAGILLPGNKTVMVSPKQTKFGETTVDSYAVSVVPAYEKTAEDYKPLTIEQMKSVIKSAIAGAQGLKQLQTIQKDVDAVTKANIAHANAMINTGAKSNERDTDGEEGKKAAREMAAYTRAAHSLNVQLVDVASKHMPKAMYDVCAIAGDVVAASLKGGEAKEEKK